MNRSGEAVTKREQTRGAGDGGKTRVDDRNAQALFQFGSILPHPGASEDDDIGAIFVPESRAHCSELIDDSRPVLQVGDADAECTITGQFVLVA